MHISASKAQGVDTDTLLPSLRPIHWLYKNGESALSAGIAELGSLNLMLGGLMRFFKAITALISDVRPEASSE